MRITRLILVLLLIPSLAFGATPIFWLKADAIVGLSDGGSVTAWADSTGNTAGAVTAPGKTAPVYKTNIQNSLPIVRFNGTTQAMTAYGPTSQPGTIIIVGKQTSKATVGRFIDGGNGFTGRQLLEFTTSGFVDIFAGTVKSDSTDHSGAFHILTGVYNGATSFAYVDGATAVSSQNAGSNIGTAQNFLGFDGTSAFLTGDIGEILIYSSALSNGDRQDKEASLAIKWGIANPTATPSATFTPTSTPTATATATPSATVNCPVFCPTATATPSATFTPTATPTATATPTVTPTPCAGGISRARVENPQ